MGALHAIKKNIVVSCAGGNNGPAPGTVSNLAPWLISVGASSIDRTVRSSVVLGNGLNIKVLVNTPQGILETSSGLLGRRNIYNIVTAVAVGIVVGAPLEGIVRVTKQGREKVKKRAHKKYRKKHSSSQSWRRERIRSQGKSLRNAHQVQVMTKQNDGYESDSHEGRGERSEVGRRVTKIGFEIKLHSSDFQSDHVEGMTKNGHVARHRKRKHDIRSQDLILALHIIPRITMAGMGKERDMDQDKDKRR
ncbi:hypothetical protein IFM89_013650 [Coptis chinensis]|uniref:Uncharacterized protein n=1 Tax=Coptis chinensis TaxID=261450 RepID=A0A835INT3_9MAGN|nr:hypothetical protein IFM89_013650 [Coptis chinensis]